MLSLVISMRGQYVAIVFITESATLVDVIARNSRKTNARDSFVELVTTPFHITKCFH